MKNGAKRNATIEITTRIEAATQKAYARLCIFLKLIIHSQKYFLEPLRNLHILLQP